MLYFQPWILAFAQATHLRLGRDSAFHGLSADLVKMVCSNKTFEDPSIAEIGANIPHIRFGTVNPVDRERFTLCDESTWNYIQWACTRLLHTFFCWRRQFQYVYAPYEWAWDPFDMCMMFEKLDEQAVYRINHEVLSGDDLPYSLQKRPGFDVVLDGGGLPEDGDHGSELRENAKRFFRRRLVLYPNPHSFMFVCTSLYQNGSLQLTYRQRSGGNAPTPRLLL
jgi:hypothetical protein